MNFLWIYLGLSAVDLAISVAGAAKIAKEFKEEGYVSTKEYKHPKLSAIWGSFRIVLLHLIPGYRLALAIGNLLHIFSDEAREQTKNNLIEKGDYRKSDAKLKEEAEAIRLEEKFKEVRDELGDGKLGEYNSLSPARKIEFLDKLEKKEAFPGGPSVTLTDEELEEFLRRERQAVIEEHNQNKNGKVLMKDFNSTIL